MYITWVYSLPFLVSASGGFFFTWGQEMCRWAWPCHQPPVYLRSHSVYRTNTAWTQARLHAHSTHPCVLILSTLSTLSSHLFASLIFSFLFLRLLSFYFGLSFSPASHLPSLLASLSCLYHSLLHILFAPYPIVFLIPHYVFIIAYPLSLVLLCFLLTSSILHAFGCLQADWVKLGQTSSSWQASTPYFGMIWGHAVSCYPIERLLFSKYGEPISCSMQPGLSFWSWLQIMFDSRGGTVV